MKQFNLDLHLVTDRELSRGRDLLDIIQAAVQGVFLLYSCAKRNAQPEISLSLAVPLWPC